MSNVVKILLIVPESDAAAFASYINTNVVKILLIVPESDAAAFASYINTNVEANYVPADLGQHLGVDGLEPHVYTWFQSNYSDVNGTGLMEFYFEFYEQSLPSGWETMTIPDRVTHCKSVEESIAASKAAVMATCYLPDPATNYNRWSKLAMINDALLPIEE